MKAQKEPRSQCDEAWKRALQLHLNGFLEICCPQVHAKINSKYRPKFLDKELGKLVEHGLSARTVDTLVEVQLKTSERLWLLIHVEVQAQYDPGFERRMFIYYYRLFDRFPNKKIVSLAILADTDPSWLPNDFSAGFEGVGVKFAFLTFKIITFENPLKIFEETGNLSALIIAVQQAALKTIGNPAKRSQLRFELTRYLVQHGVEGAAAIELLRVMSAIMNLSQQWELKLERRLTKVAKRDKPMAELLTNFEIRALNRGRQLGRKEGLQEGRQEGRQEGLQRGQQEGGRKALQAAVLSALEVRFGKVPAPARKKIAAVVNNDDLQAAHRAAIISPDIKSFLKTLG